MALRRLQAETVSQPAPLSRLRRYALHLRRRDEQPGCAQRQQDNAFDLLQAGWIPGRHAGQRRVRWRSCVLALLRQTAGRRDVGHSLRVSIVSDEQVSQGTADPSHDRLRPLLFSIAYRMLGTVGDAEDVVQDAFLRLERARLEGVGVPPQVPAAM